MPLRPPAPRTGAGSGEQGAVLGTSWWSGRSLGPGQPRAEARSKAPRLVDCLFANKSGRLTASRITRSETAMDPTHLIHATELTCSEQALRPDVGAAVPAAGFEPARALAQRCVGPLRLPVHVTGSGRGCTVWLSEMSKVREGRTWYSGPRRHPDFAMDLSTQKVW